MYVISLNFFALIATVSAGAQELNWEARYGPKIQDLETRIEAACSINRYSLSAADTVGKNAVFQAEHLRSKLIREYRQVQNPLKDLSITAALTEAVVNKKDLLDFEVERLDEMRADRTPSSAVESQRVQVIHAKHGWDSAQNAVSIAQTRAEAKFKGGMIDPESVGSYGRTLDQVDGLYSKALGCWSKQMGLACDANFMTQGNDAKCWFDSPSEKSTDASH